jgi:hypothetical protein
VGNGDGDGFSIIAEKEVPDIYTDSVGFEVSLYGVTLEFGKSRRAPPGHQGRAPHFPRVRVHMSPQHAKIMAKVFAKNMRGYEEQVGKIPIPKEVLDELKLKDEWGEE